MPLEEDDPVIASYNVFISPPIQSDTTSPTSKSSGLYVLQYPSHRSSTRPYSTARAQKPTSLRLKSNTGIIELDVPILTSDNYNLPLGSQFGKAMHESHLAHPLTTHGLSGGFSHNQNAANNSLAVSDVPQHGIDTTLHTQTLGGKMSTNTDKDPIYMLATLKPNSRQLHLQHLDAVVQLRPQLHHIDAAEEIKKRVETAATARTKPSATNNVSTDPSVPVKLETKAIELKLKDNSKDDPKDRNQNENARLLREIQNDPWLRYEWIEKTRANNINNTNPASTFGATSATETITTRPPLKAALDNDEWLNKMSSPGIELRTRLKGRDRERARRKRQERTRTARGEAAAAVAIQDISESGSDSDASDDEDGQDHDDPRMGGTEVHPDADEVDQRPVSPVIQIKQEPSAGGPSTTSIPTSTSETTAGTVAGSPPKRRGRPAKSKAG